MPGGKNFDEISVSDVDSKLFSLYLEKNVFSGKTVKISEGRNCITFQWWKPETQSKDTVFPLI